MITFHKDNILAEKLKYPQSGDPTNCVVYNYMNFMNEQEPFEKFIKENGGHTEDEELNILNSIKDKFGIEEIQDKDLYLKSIANNGGNLYEGLTLGQLKWGLDYWDYVNMDTDEWFSVVKCTVASKMKRYGRHAVTLFWDGKGGGNKGEFILCDPQINNYVKLDCISDLVMYYKIVLEMSIFSYYDNGMKTIYFKKEKFPHLPLEHLKK